METFVFVCVFVDSLTISINHPVLLETGSEPCIAALINRKALSPAIVLVIVDIINIDYFYL